MDLNCKDLLVSKYTDGKEVVVAVLFKDNRRSAYYAFNLINDVPLDSLTVPIRAIEYIINNGRITLRNGQVANHGDYIVKYRNNECRVCSFAEFKQQYTLIPEENDMTTQPNNTVTKEDIDALMEASTKEFAFFDNTMTIAVVKLPSGFKVTGQSSCVDPANFNEEDGKKYALEQVKNKLWELEGYLLANRLYDKKVRSYQGGV